MAINELSTMTRQFIVIIEKVDYETGRFINESELTKMLDEIAINYYFILHDKDINDKTGELERPHYHLVFTTAKRVRLGTILNRISKICNIAKLGITIDIAFNYNYIAYNGKTYKSKNYYIELDNGYRIQIKPAFKDSYIKLDLVAHEIKYIWR